MLLAIVVQNAIRLVARISPVNLLHNSPVRTHAWAPVHVCADMQCPSPMQHVWSNIERATATPGTTPAACGVHQIFSDLQHHEALLRELLRARLYKCMRTGV